MEDLARAVAGILALFATVAIVDVVVAIFARRGKIRLWIGHLVNTLTGLLAIFGISVAWALGAIPLFGVIVSSIILTWPKRRQ